MRQPCGGSSACSWLSCNAVSLTSTSGFPCGTGHLGAASLVSRGPPAVSSSSAFSWVLMLCGTGSWKMPPTGGCLWVRTAPLTPHLRPTACPNLARVSLLPHSVGPVSSLIPPSADTVAVGLVSSVVVYPVYLAILFLFRMTRSKVGWDWGAALQGRVWAPVQGPTGRVSEPKARSLQRSARQTRS